jgi:hypothetical protein
MNEAKIKILTEQLNSIHLTNVLYWTAGEEPDRAARAEYRRREDRLREVRAELYRHLVAQASAKSESSRSSLPLIQRA